jgi:perosamine synthetase
MINFFTPEITSHDRALLNKVCKTGWISSQGSTVKQFEQEFALWHKMKFAVAVSNCTVALHLSLLAAKIKKGDEVICTNLTFIAPANMILLSGAKLVLIDIEKENFTMNLEKIENKITKKTKAILVVHPFGCPVDMIRVMKIAKKYNLKVIEDVAEAIGAKFKEKLCGTFGDMSCFSFFANKIMTTGEGGMILTNNKKTYLKLKLLRDHGMTQEKKYYHKVLAFNYRMTAMQAAIGLSQLRRLDKILKKRESIEKLYYSYLKNKLLKYKIFREFSKDIKPVNWFITITLKKPSFRNSLIKYLLKNNIETRPMIFPLSFATHIKNMSEKKDALVSKIISLSSLHLPSFNNISSRQIKYICNKILIWSKDKNVFYEK